MNQNALSERKEAIVKSVEDGQVVFTVDGNDVTFPSQSHISVGQIGTLVVRSEDHASFSFWAYMEPRLRRVPEKDIPAGNSAAHGSWCWRLIDEDRNFYVREGIVPGKGGRFIPDETQSVDLDVPIEFIDLCQSKGLTPDEVLRGFIADLCELQSFVVNPREDRYSSNGSDERQLANDWFQRAYG